MSCIDIVSSCGYAALTMDVSFADDDLDRLELDPAYTMDLASEIVKAYRKRLQQIRSATDSRDFYGLKSSHFEKLKGKRQHQHSMRLNKKYRLIIELEDSADRKRVKIMGVEDYH